LNEAQETFFKEKIVEQALKDRDVQRMFSRAKRSIPRSEDEWNDLQLERADIYEDFARVRDKVYEGELRKLYLEGAIAQNYNKVKESAFFDAAQVLQKNLLEDNISVPETDKRMENLIIDGIKFLDNELTKAEREGRQPDSRYFYPHPVTGQPIPRTESLDTYLRLNRKDVLKEMPTWTEPVQDTPVDDGYYQRVLDDMFTSLQTAFDKHGLEITPDDPLIAEGLSHILQQKDNPLYWDNGKPKPDALVTYQRFEKPTLISDVYEIARRDAAAKERATLTDKLNQEWQKRLKQTHDTSPSIASSISQSAPGQTIPIVPPEVFKSQMQMIKLAKKYGMPPMEFYDQQKGRIEQLPPQQQRLYI